LAAARGSRAGERLPKKAGEFPLTPLSARAILSRRIPAANASFTITPLFPASAVFAEIPPFRPPAFTVSPRQPSPAQTATRTARLSGLSPSSNPWKSCCVCLPRLGRLRRLPSEPWTAFDKDRPSIGSALKFSSLTPQDSARKTRRALPPRARNPADYLPGVRKPAGLLSGATGTEKTPATFRVPFLCAVRSRPPVLHAGQP